MKRIAILLVLAATAIGALQAQHAPREWGRGPLTWDDFTGPVPPNNVDNWLEYNFTVKRVEEKLDGMNLMHLRLCCNMYPELSWAAESAKTDLNLKYNQVVFNIAEYQSLCFQPLLDQGNTGMDIESVLQMALSYSAAEEQRFSNESDMGFDTAVVQRWYDSTNLRLSELKAENGYHPRVEYTGIGMSANFSLGTTIHGRSLAETFTPAFDFGFGFDMGFKRNVFLWDMKIGIGGSRQDFVLDDVYYLAGSSYTWFQTFLGYGYSVLDKPRFSLTPFVGLGCSMIEEDDPMSDEIYSDVSGPWLAGVMADWKFTCSISDCDQWGERTADYWSLRAMLYVSRANLCGCRSASITLSLAINGGLKNLRLR